VELIVLFVIVFSIIFLLSNLGRESSEEIYTSKFIDHPVVFCNRKVQKIAIKMQSVATLIGYFLLERALANL
jgi:hypothetical protein